jgi:mono/diheme cytochrome c family protein
MKTALYIILAIALTSYSCITRKSEPITRKTVDKGDARIANGEILFNRYCDKCHPGGEAGLGPTVYYKPGFAKKFQARHGMGVMPAFTKDQISKNDLKNIAYFLKKKQHLRSS